jgi:membrane protease YdiL (CAAX protease family)
MIENFSPYLHILLAVSIYFCFAISATIIARKTGINLKKMAGRTSPRLLLIGTVANLGALISILYLIKKLDGKPINALGLMIQTKDLIFSIVGIIATFGLAVLYIFFLKRGNHFRVVSHTPIEGMVHAKNLIFGLLVLLLVAGQEEVLYRGYIFLNLDRFSPIAKLILSSLIFVGIHFLTNRVNLHQVLSWLLSGLILGATYWVSGSIWVPILIHFAIDATNIFIFNITGQFSFYKILPELTERDRTGYRVVFGLAMLTFMLVIYGPVSKFL